MIMMRQTYDFYLLDGLPWWIDQCQAHSIGRLYELYAFYVVCAYKLRSQGQYSTYCPIRPILYCSSMKIDNKTITI